MPCVSWYSILSSDENSDFKICILYQILKFLFFIFKRITSRH